MSAAIDVCWSTSFTCNDVFFFSGKSVLQLTQTENFLINVRACVRLSLQLHPTGSLWTGTFSLQQEWWLHFLHSILSHVRRCVSCLGEVCNIDMNLKYMGQYMMKIQSLLFFITFSNLWWSQRPSVTITYSKRGCKSLRVMLWIRLNQCYFFQLHGSCQDLTNQ